MLNQKKKSRNPQKKILIIDGNYAAWRSYATRKLRTSTGIETSVISGMLQSFKTLFYKFRYDTLIICWDGEGGSEYRKGIFKEYKAQRKELHEKHKSVFIQMDTARKFFRELNVRQIRLKGVEGDDLMGILSNHFANPNKVIIVSADRDLLQLVKSNISVFRPMGKRSELITTNNFARKLNGLSTKEFIKIKSLVGDKGDNIPGVPGIGPKRASDLVKKYGTIKEINKNRKRDKYAELVMKNIKVVLRAYILSKIFTKPKGLIDKEKFDKVINSLNRFRTVNISKMKEQVSKYEMKHRNFPMLANILSLEIYK